MKKNIVRYVGVGLLVAIWAVLTAIAWFQPSKDISDSERRKLEQFPVLSGETIRNGSFMSKFEDYTLDQFPFRDSFRQLKSLFHYNVLNQKDNNDIYLVDGYAAKLEYPLKAASVSYASSKFNWIYDNYLADTDSRITMCIIPDKGYYLAEANGYPAMDYETLFQTIAEKTPWATQVDITDQLSVEDYYYTDTHWRQEKLIPVAQKLCDALGVTAPKADDFTQTQIERPFYGVYYGQAALPMDSEPLYILESDLLNECTVSNFETGKTTNGVYDMEKAATSRDLYDVYLSGAASLLTITNPNAATDKELIVFRDSFGSSIVPLLVQDYKTVTLVDIRYIASNFLGEQISFHGQDVLFLYSSLILNSSNSLK